MPDKTLAKRLQRIRELYAKATQGPYFVSSDDAQDAPVHRDSGLAMIDTGRQSDYPVLRLGEWPTTQFLAELGTAWPELDAKLTRLSSRVEELEGVLRYARAVIESYCILANGNPIDAALSTTPQQHPE